MAFTYVNPGTLLAPTPCVMVSAATATRRPNIITIAWTGVVNSDPPMLSISVRESRHSYALITESGEFVVNLVHEPLLKAADFCGVKSGRDTDKFAACGLTPVRAAAMQAAPAIGEAPLHLACKVRSSIPLGSHTMFLAEIVSAGVNKSLMDDSGRIDLGKAGLIAYQHGEYLALGEKLGFFGYSVARPDVLERRMAGR